LNNIQEKKRVLVFASQPLEPKVTPVGEGAEVRKIQEVLSEMNNEWEVIPVFAAQKKDIAGKIIQHNPEIVHFCAHGHDAKGIVLVDGDNRRVEIDPENLADCFKMCSPQVRCVVLNICHSLAHAKEMSRHIDFSVGMKGAVEVDDAIRFSAGFYRALAGNHSVSSAFQYGCWEMEIGKSTGYVLPVMYPGYAPAAYNFHPDIPLNEIPVYLAEPSDDLYDKWIELKRHLEQQGTKVYPDEFRFCSTETDRKNVIEPCLARCGLYIQLWSASYEKRSPNMSNPMPQYRLAWRKRLDMLHWIKEPIPPAGKEKAELPESCDLIHTSFENFKQIVTDRLRRLAIENSRQSEPTESRPFVFVNTDENADDLLLGEEISRFLHPRNVAVAQPVRGGIPPGQKLQDLKKNLGESDAVIIVYYQADVLWVREQLRLCWRVEQERKRPMKVLAVCDRPSASDKPRIDFQMPNFRLLTCPVLEMETCMPSFLKAMGIE
jgi:hypothetical protein